MKVFERDGVTLHRGDCLDVMRAMPDASVDAIVTDPPYGTGQWTRPGAGFGDTPKAKHTRESWDIWDTAWIDEALRVSRGPVAFFLPNKRIADAIGYAVSRGESWRLFIWCKPDPMPTFTGQPSFGFEPIFALRAGESAGGKDWIEASTPKRNSNPEATGHKNQKPLKVMRWLCSMVARHGETILDPFAGSGSTLVACQMTGRNGVGIELDPQWPPVIEARCRAAEAPLLVGL